MAEGNVTINKDEGKVIKRYADEFGRVFWDEVENLTGIRNINYPHLPNPFDVDPKKKEITLPYRGEDFEKVFYREGYNRKLTERLFDFMMEEAHQLKELDPDELALKRNTDNPLFETDEFLGKGHFEEDVENDMKKLSVEKNSPVTYTKYDPEASNLLKQNGNIYSTDFRFMRPSEEIFLPIYFALHLDTPKNVDRIKESGKIRDDLLNLSKDYAGKDAALRNIIEVLLYHGNGLINKPREELDEKGKLFLERIGKIPEILVNGNYIDNL